MVYRRSVYVLISSERHGICMLRERYDQILRSPRGVGGQLLLSFSTFVAFWDLTIVCWARVRWFDPAGVFCPLLTGISRLTGSVPSKCQDTCLHSPCMCVRHFVKQDAGLV